MQYLAQLNVLYSLGFQKPIFDKSDANILANQAMSKIKDSLIDGSTVFTWAGYNEETMDGDANSEFRKNIDPAIKIIKGWTGASKDQ